MYSDGVIEATNEQDEQFGTERLMKVIDQHRRSPNLNAYAERFVRSIKDECLSRVVPLGEGHLRRLVYE